jgi:RND superfamily putative drug exporter
MGVMKAWYGLVTGRRTKWVVVVLGVVVVALVGPLAGKLSKYENNSPASFLPSGAPSTRVSSFLAAHSASAPVPAVVVFARSSGLSGTDRSDVAAARAAVTGLHLAQPSPTQLSTNDRAATFSVPLPADTAETAVTHDVADIRRVVDSRAGNMTVAVGGPAGAAADAAGAFSGIDGKLLIVTVAIVALLLLAIYRSPLLWLVPLVSVGLAAGWAEGAAYGLARAGFTINGMTIGILSVLVFGAGTDYALLLIARYREELRRHDDHHEALAIALSRAAPAIAVSGSTVVLALLCLLAAQLSDIAALGPACAAGIVCALVAQLGFLPALLAVVGRRAFWPFVPRPGQAHAERAGTWSRVSRLLSARPRSTWTALSLLLVVCCVGLVAYRGGVNQQNGFRGKVGSVVAQQLISADFPRLSVAPAVVLVRPPSGASRAARVASSTPGVSAVGAIRRVGPADTFDVSLSNPPAGAAARHTVELLRSRIRSVAGPDALVGGQTATDIDTATAAGHDREVVIPLVVLVVIVMLGLLLRAIVAPLFLVGSVLLSYAASLGISAVVFRYVFGFPGFDPSVPIFGFVFLVALGVDYNIFLMARAREEVAAVGPSGVMRALAVTGGVITSAGVVLAATFSVLAVLPLIALTEVGFLVAFGVLVDTFLVRSALIPTLAVDLGRRWWWPSDPTRPSDVAEHSSETPVAGAR